MAATSESRIRTAIRKAQAEKLYLRVEPFTFTCYGVQGSHGFYFVDVRPGRRWDCTCPAGKVGILCKHAAAVHLYRASAQAFGIEPIPQRAA